MRVAGFVLLLPPHQPQLCLPTSKLCLLLPVTHPSPLAILTALLPHPGLKLPQLVVHAYPITPGMQDDAYGSSGSTF